ncbi:hypothetical protein FRB90_010268 [Tulasnella sp. 427]|nr:hypothetical protein FRB90_010268 [Tulasnella sp. 427]
MHPVDPYSSPNRALIKEIIRYMSPRFFWFFVGGASAALWMHKHEERRQMWSSQQADGSYPSWGRCMQHSWYWKHRRGQLEEQTQASAAAVEGDELNMNQASEQLVTAVKTGIRNVMDTLVSIENVSNLELFQTDVVPDLSSQAFREEKAEAERRMRERPAPSNTAAPAEPSVQRPVARVDHEPSSVPSIASEKVPAYSPVPNAQPTPQTSDPTMSQILAALEKINAKLDK